MVEEAFIFPYCKHKILTVTQLWDKGKVEGLDMVGGRHRRQVQGKREPAGACWLPQHIHILSKELTLPLRRTKQASKGNVQNRNQKMSTSSRADKQAKKNQLSVPEPRRGWGVSGFLRPFPVSPTLCLPQ